jgi:hypothetical protein
MSFINNKNRLNKSYKFIYIPSLTINNNFKCFALKPIQQNCYINKDTNFVKFSILILPSLNVDLTYRGFERTPQQSYNFYNKGFKLLATTKASHSHFLFTLPDTSNLKFFIVPTNLKNSTKRRYFSTFDKVSKVSMDEFFEKQNFWNLSFDKGRIKTLVSWFLKNYGQKKTIQLVENLKDIGFEYATKAGISLGIDDLKISPNKALLIAEAEKQTYEVITQYKRAQITGVERFQRLIDTWHRTSESLKQEVINYFEITDLLNPVYMMAFSGARGNISQVRQLVGMRGLMADPKGQILDFPIRSNFREGLTLTEYLISSYGARKGIVDTALRTANAGYLTRRLVDVAQHVIVSHYDCGTNKGILISDMKEGSKVIYSLQNRLIGRVLAQDIYSSTGPIAIRNQEISSELAGKISKVVSKVLIRSALTCETRKLICQLCYGWSLGQGKLVSIGDAVGVIAAQSIGEPGTQLTMRTFHTGGVFSSDVNDQIIGPYDGIIQYSSYIPGTLVRTPQGKIAFLTKAEGSFVIKSLTNKLNLQDDYKTKFFKIPSYTLLFCRHNEEVYFKQVVAQICSSSTQNKQRDDAEQSIQTELQGQVYMDRLTLIEQTNDYGDSSQQSWDWGYIWILSGKIYEIPVDSYIFPKFGDFINQHSILNQIQWIVPDKSEFNLTVKKYFYENFINNKLPNKKNKKLLHNLKLRKNSLNFLTEVSGNTKTLPVAEAFEKKPSFSEKKNYLMRKSEPNEQEFNNLEKSITNALTFKIVKQKFHNILSVKGKLDNSIIVNEREFSNLNFLSESLGTSNFINKKKFSVSTNLNFKRPLLLFDTDRFIYKKLGYFFQVNLPLSIQQIHLSRVYNKSNFISENDKFFIPVNLNPQNKLFTTHFFTNLDSKFTSSEKKLENSFDWKNFPHTLLTWFPFFYEKKGSSLISYEINHSSYFNLNTLDDPEIIILKQKNPIFYSRIIKNLFQFPLRNLNSNQIIYNKFKINNVVYSLNSAFNRNKKFWVFSDKHKIGAYFSTREKIFKRTLDLSSVNQMKNLQHSNFKKYAELKWKNSNTFYNQKFFYRGRILWIPHPISKILTLENTIHPVSSIKQKQFKFNSFNWQNKDSLLYYNFNRQGKKVPVFSDLDGFIQIYRKSIFPSGSFQKNQQLQSKIIGANYKINPKRSYKSSNFSYLAIANNNKIFQSIKKYNKKYYVALKFKLKKINSNHQDLKNIILPMNSKNYQKLIFLKSAYLNTNFLVHKFQLIKNKFFIFNNLSRINCLKIKNSNNPELLSSMFKFSFLNFNQSFNKQLIFNKLKPRLTTLVLQVQSGWVYIPNQLTSNLIKYHKSIIPLGKVLMDDVMFDGQLVYLEFLPIKDVFLKYNLNFLNVFASFDLSHFAFSKKNTLHKSIKQKHKARNKSTSSPRVLSFTTCLNFKFSGFSVNNLTWVSNLKLRSFNHQSNRLSLDNNYVNNFKVNTLFLSSDINSFALNSFLEKNQSTKFHVNSVDIPGKYEPIFTNRIRKSQSHFILIIKKVHEYNIQEMSYYKNNLYNSQITNFNTNFSLLLKQNYYTSGFNKQFKNLRLISKFPNVDLQIEPKFKISSDTKQTSSVLLKKTLKSSSREVLKADSFLAGKSDSIFNSTSYFNRMKIFFYNKSSSLLYFKLHFINNSTFEMYYKKPVFTFNYLNSPNFSTFFSSYFDFMYTHILNNLVSPNPHFKKNKIVKNLQLFNYNKKKSTSDLAEIALLFSFNLSKLFFKPLFDFSLSQNPSYFFNDRFFVKTRLTQLFSGSNIKNIGLSISSQNSSFNSALNSFPTVQNSYIFKTSSKLLEKQPFAYSSFLSPYEGEFLVKNNTNWNTTFQKNRLLILTKTDLVSFDVKNLFFTSNLAENHHTQESFSLTNKNTSIHNDIFIKSSKKVYKIDNLLVTEPKLKNVFLVGEFISYGDQINQNIAISQAGQVVHLSRKKLTIRKGQSIFLSSKAILHAYNGDLIDKNFPVVTLPYQKLKAGDIVQGIPKIEQFFEARITRRGRLFRDSIPNLLKGLFKRYKLKYPLVKAVRQSFYKIQQILVDGVQRVYRSQGVTIADKHIEIIVKQMTCKVKIINGGQTGFFPGELVDLEFVEQINKVLMNKVYYEPVVLGITKASLEVESFLSAASFQQTTRMLSKAAISRKKDFLKGLKENVIVGNLIPSGTGYLVYLQDINKNFKI